MIKGLESDLSGFRSCANHFVYDVDSHFTFLGLCLLKHDGNSTYFLGSGSELYDACEPLGELVKSAWWAPHSQAFIEKRWGGSSDFVILTSAWARGCCWPGGHASRTNVLGVL